MLQYLEFIYHAKLSKLSNSSGMHAKYCFYCNKLSLYPVLDKAYTINIKYLTAYFAVNSYGSVNKSNL